MSTVKVFFFLGVLFALVLSLAVSLSQTATAQANSAQELVGLWQAKHRFGPDVRGTLLIKQNNGEWQTEIAGRVAQTKTSGDSISFELADGQGKFRGKFDARRTKIVGHWIQPGIEFESGVPYASPVTLTKDKQNVWHGEVSPLEMTLTFYLMIKAREDGSVGAFLRNPERNLGWTNHRVDRIERDGATVKLLAANKGDEKGRVLLEGRYDNEEKIMSLYPLRGESYDFRRVDANAPSDFYPRGRPTGTYRYAPPSALDDGWQTGTLEEVGISRTGIEKLVQMFVDAPTDSVNSPAVHGVLIARHGKLVLEEYFYGENREKAHDTRSASKSVAADLIGAAIYSGVPLKTSVPVYQVMNNGEFPPDLEPRKRAMTLEHLLTMSSGLDCDDYLSPEKSPGYEDNMWEQTAQPDFYKWTMALNVIRQPGEKGVYCSASPNLAGGVLARVAKQKTQELFQKLLAEPLQIKHYYLTLSPLEDYTMTGGARFLPRDFMKLGQVHVGGGVWNGRRIFTPEWSRRATSHLVDIGTGKYGYLWWVQDYKYKGRTVRAFFAGGNGGQVVMGIPDLDLVIAFYGGNYADRAGFKVQNVYVPEYILPAIDK